jgi:hypothetical protein
MACDHNLNDLNLKNTQTTNFYKIYLNNMSTNYEDGF